MRCLSIILFGGLLSKLSSAQFPITFQTGGPLTGGPLISAQRPGYLGGPNDPSATDLSACWGECDSDDQCKEGLKCFQRTGFTPVPGCEGQGMEDWDYCYDPTGSIELSGGNDSSATNLQACTGECDNDAQCAFGLKCFQRDNGETIPGCTGSGGGANWDYCYDPNWSAQPDDIPSFTLAQGWEQGQASDCQNIQCTTEEGGLEACADLCLGDPDCNVFNFCPEGADCTSGLNRCCRRTCDSREELNLVTRFRGWDVYVRDELFGRILDATRYEELEERTTCRFGYEHVRPTECQRLGTELRQMETSVQTADGVCFVTETQQLVYDASAPAGAVGFHCKEIQATDNLEASPVVGSTECSDDDITTSCSSNEALEFDLREPLMLLRVQVRNVLNRPLNSSLDVSVFDGHSWSFCYRDQYILPSTRWLSIECPLAVYAEKISIRAVEGPVALAEIRPFGIRVVDGQLEDITSDRDWREYPRFASCSDDATISTLNCRDGDCSDSALQEMCASIGPHCWGYAKNFTAVSFVTAAASNIYECEGPIGLMRNLRYTFHRRPFKQTGDVAIVQGPCYTYEMASGTLTRDVGRFCSELENGLADAVEYQLNPIARCGIARGWEKVGTSECLPYQIFQINLNYERAVQFEEQLENGITEQCRRTRRMEDSSTDFNSLRAPRRRQAPPSECEITAEVERSQRCNMLREALALRVDIAAARSRVAELQDAEDSRSAMFELASGIVGTTGTAIDTAGGTTTAAGNGEFSGRRRAALRAALEHFDSETPNGSNSTAPTSERRREPTLVIGASITLIGGLTGVAAGAIDTANGALSAEAQAEIDEAQAVVNMLLEEQDLLRQTERAAETCNVVGNGELSCQLERLGLGQEQIQSAISSGFANTIALLERNNIETLRAFERQNQILGDQSRSLDRIESALDRIEDRLDLLINIKTEVSDAVEIVNVVSRSMMEEERRGRILEQDTPSQWCDYFDKVGGTNQMNAIRTWALSEEFRELAMPEINRIEGEENLITQCEVDQWVAEYTDNFQTVQMVFEYTVMRLMYFVDYRESTVEIIKDIRDELNEEYNRNVDEIRAMFTNNAQDVIRCVGEPFTCPPGFHDVSNGVLESVTRLPCDLNDCRCPPVPSQALMRDERCTVHQQTEGCSGSAPENFHPETIGGLTVFRRDEATCSLGRPETDITLFRAGFEHLDEQCAEDGCMTDRAFFNENNQLCELHQCLCDGGTGARGSSCPEGRRGLDQALVTARIGTGLNDYCTLCRGRRLEQTDVQISRRWLRPSPGRVSSTRCIWTQGQQYDDSFRLRECRFVSLEGEVFLPRSNGGRILLMPLPGTRTVETSNNRIDVFINDVLRIRETQQRAVSFALNGNRGDRVRIRIELTSTTSNRFAHRHWTLTYRQSRGTGEPMRFIAPDGVESSTCDIRNLRFPNGF